MREFQFPSRIREPKGYHDDCRIAYAEPAQQGIAGRVVLDAVIGKDGIVQTLAVREGDPRLAEEALRTVRHWVYRPLLLNGRPVEVAAEIEVNFG